MKKFNEEVDPGFTVPSFDFAAIIERILDFIRGLLGIEML